MKANLHVCPSMRGGWQVRRTGSARALSRHEYLEDAMNKAHRLALAEKNVLYCHKRDGTILMRLAYGAGL